MTQQPAPEPLFTLRGDMDGVHSLFFQLNGGSEYIYASTQSGKVHKWNLKSCREDSRVEVSQEACLSVNCLQKCMISQIKGGELKLWEEIEETWKLKTVVNIDYLGFCKLDVCNDNFFVCPEFGSKIRIVAPDGGTINTFSTASTVTCGEIMAVKCFKMSGTDYIFVLFENGLLNLFRTSGDKVSDCKITSDCPMALDFDSESKGVIGSSGDVIVGFELKSNLQLVKWKEIVITNKGVSCVVIRPDRKLFAAGCWDYRVRLFSMKSFKLLVVLQNHKETIQDICYSPMGVDAFKCQWLLAAAGKDGRITLWDVY